MTDIKIREVLHRAARAADRLCRDRAAGTLKARREWREGRPQAIAAALRYLTHRAPAVTDTKDALLWPTPDGDVTVTTTPGLAAVDLHQPDGTTVELTDPVALAKAILSAWMTLGDVTTGRE